MKLQQLAAEQQELTFRPAVNRTGTARINLRNPETYLQTLKARNEARAQQAKDEVRRRLVSIFLIDSIFPICHAPLCRYIAGLQIGPDNIGPDAPPAHAQSLKGASPLLLFLMHWSVRWSTNLLAESSWDCSGAESVQETLVYIAQEAWNPCHLM